MRKILFRNIFKFFIGSGLLIISFFYLQNHPAEKSAVFSGFEVMWQKVNIFIHKVVYKNWDVLQKKYNLQKYYKELFRMAEGLKCLDTQTVSAISSWYEELKSISLKEFSNKIEEYTRQIYKYDSIVKKWCN